MGVRVPIKPEMRGFYPSDWPQISRRVRFERAAGICQGCPISRRQPRCDEPRVILAAAHLDHNPGNNRCRNLKSLCQRCHLIHDRPHHLMQRRITYLLRRALGDLFLGPYRRVAATA
jgi:hypothetical protein